MWDSAQGDVSVQDPDGWKRIAGFVAGKPAVLLFNPADENAVFLFNEGRQAIESLEEIPRVEFYLADPGLSFLLCFNHHDFLIGCGSAADWVDPSTTVLAPWP